MNLYKRLIDGVEKIGDKPEEHLINREMDQGSEKQLVPTRRTTFRYVITQQKEGKP